MAIVAVGSHGDVAPYTGLAQTLRDRGHGVTIAAHEGFAGLVSSSGAAFAALPFDPRAALHPPPGERADGASPAALGRGVRLWASRWRQMAEATVAAVDGADLVLTSTLGWLSYHVAEAMRIPSMGVFLQPMDPTREFAPCVLTSRSFGGWGNRALAGALRSAGQWPFAAVVRELRASLGLPAERAGRMFRRMDAERWPVAYGFSRQVVAQPGDWPPWRNVVGYLWPHRPRQWRPPARLVEFLDAGAPPVFVGFGSMRVADTARVGELVVSALRRARVRGIVASGWAGLAPGDQDDIFCVDEIPHDWLFPRLAGVVHHAGAGTTAAGLRAGIPAVTVPVLLDQPFWAARVAAMGAGPAPIPMRRLTADRLAAAIEAMVSRPAYRDRARQVSSRIGAEDGAGRIADAVEELHQRGAGAVR
ncbi:glycosyltransferase [Micromonospora sp. NPDC050686]|uniref:glycosyltransferase n=1 Tax=Micromonospora sp. NPDC050686 TaxID=3154631 RepID=UPI003406FD93